MTKFIKKNKFMPYLHTNIEISKIDSILLIKYTKNRIIDSSYVCIKDKYPDTDTNNTKWRFMLCDSFEVGFNYRINIFNGKKNQTYNFEQVIYDTVACFKGYRYDVKSYYLNGIKYSSQNCNFTLPD